MKKIIVLVFLFFISFNICNSQSGWFIQQSSLSAVPYDIFFIDSQTGWISCDTGKVLKTTNGGTNWILYLTDASCNLYTIKFINSLTGWAAGSLPVYNPYSYEHAVIVKTTNGGVNWVTQYNNSNSYKINTISIADENNVFATSYGTDESGYATTGYLFKTSNSGVSWETSAISGPGFTNVFFLNQVTGWSCAFAQTDVPPTYRMIYKTTNTGINWIRIYKDTLNWFSPLFYKIQMIDTSIGYIRTDLLKKTTNSGNNWNNIDSLNTYVTNDFFFISKDTGWVCKNPIKYTSNGGLNWTNQTISYNVNKLFFINNKTGWAIGNYPVVLLKTINGGTPFTISGTVRYADNNQPAIGGYVKAIKFDRSSNNIITYDSTQIQTDGSYALTHVPQDSVDIGIYPNSTTQNDWIITYYPSTIYWQSAMTLYPTGNLTNINIGAIRLTSTNANNSVNGKVMSISKSTIAGLKDAVLYVKYGSIFVRCAMSDGNGVYNLQSLPSGNVRIIVDRMGYDGDSTIVTVTSISSLDSINFYLRYLYTGIKIIESTVPSEYKLYQNYPNPFNPTTNIKYQIINNLPQQITLKIYDILGKKVATLVNEKQTAGMYEITFDGSRLASGIYFYKIETGNYSEIKKMLLIK
jgi:photosystem II stability/assembly factor-like uncharacterized protein